MGKYGPEKLGIWPILTQCEKKRKIKRLKSEPKKLYNKNIKHPYSNQTRERAEKTQQFYRATIHIKEERVKSTAGTEMFSVENLHPIVIDEASAENNILGT